MKKLTKKTESKYNTVKAFVSTDCSCESCLCDCTSFGKVKVSGTSSMTTTVKYAGNYNASA